MCDISWNCSVYIGSAGKGETDKWKRHTNYSKSNKSGRHSIWGPRLVVFRYIYTGRITKIGCCVRACHIFVAFFCVQPGKLYGFFEGLHTLSCPSSHSLQKIMARTEYHLWLYIMTGFLHPKSIIIFSQRCYALWSLLCSFNPTSGWWLWWANVFLWACISCDVFVKIDGKNSRYT